MEFYLEVIYHEVGVASSDCPPLAAEIGDGTGEAGSDL